MTKIIKNVTLASDGPDSWTGERYVELELDCDGKTVFAAVSDIAEDAYYVVAKQSVLDFLREFKKIPEEMIIEQHNTGNADLFEHEEEMAKSEYYNAFLYMHTLVDMANDLEKEDTEEYTEDIGEDVDEMDLSTLSASSQVDGLLMEYACYKDYIVLNVRVDESNDMFMTAYSAEATIMDQGEMIYLEVSWASEAPDDISCEKNFESIHDDMIDVEKADMERIESIRSAGKIYDDLESAINTKYGEEFCMLIRLISEKLAEDRYFEEYYEEDEYPKWYKLEGIETE